MPLNRATLSDLAVRAALGVPVAWHGAWNLGAAGARWWAEDSGLPPALRFVIGAAELAASAALLTDRLARHAAAGLFVIFLGALPQHTAQGFSFKDGGWEPILVYLLLSLSVALRAPSREVPHER